MKGVTLFLLAGLFVAMPATAKAPSIAITVDDLPAHGPLPPGATRLMVAAEMISALVSARVPATGFVAGSFGAGDPDSPKVLAAWKAAKFPIGNHTFSHPHLSAAGAVEFMADIVKNESFTQGQPRLLRYPYLDEGHDAKTRDAVREALAKRGYRIAAVTMSFDDYAYNDPYVRCLASHDDAAVAALEARYLASARVDAERARAITKATLGRDIPHVLLLHIGAFTAHMLPQLIAQYRELGFSFTTLNQAQKDPFYAAAVDPLKPGPSPSLDPLEQKMETPLRDDLPIPGNEVCPAK
jgi:peptidoglycan/xylan/chitin deacetylase (PgdA/CDA1 family)